MEHYQVTEHPPTFHSPLFFAGDVTTSSDSGCIKTVDGKTYLDMDMPPETSGFSGPHDSSHKIINRNTSQSSPPLKIKPVVTSLPGEYTQQASQQAECSNGKDDSTRHLNHLSGANDTITGISSAASCPNDSWLSTALEILQIHETRKNGTSSQQLQDKYPDQWMEGYVMGFSTQPAKAAAYLQSFMSGTSSRGQQIPSATSHTHHQMWAPQSEIPQQNQLFPPREMGYEVCYPNTVNGGHPGPSTPQTKKNRKRTQTGHPDPAPAKRSLMTEIQGKRMIRKRTPELVCFLLNILEHPSAINSIKDKLVINSELMMWNDRDKGIFFISPKRHEIIVEHYNATCSKSYQHWESMSRMLRYYCRNGTYFLKYHGDKEYQKGFRQINTQHPEIKPLLMISKTNQKLNQGTVQ